MGTCMSGEGMSAAGSTNQYTSHLSSSAMVLSTRCMLLLHSKHVVPLHCVLIAHISNTRR
jgi:hypothetical protein